MAFVDRPQGLQHEEGVSTRGIVEPADGRSGGAFRHEPAYQLSRLRLGERIEDDAALRSRAVEAPDRLPLPGFGLEFEAPIGNANEQRSTGEIGSQCVECGCRVECKVNEFGCPSGYQCKNGFCVPDKCIGVKCEDDQMCVDGMCVNPCAEVTCEGDTVCKQGRCVENNCYGLGCTAGQLCIDAKCQDDPCASVVCGAGWRA